MVDEEALADRGAGVDLDAGREAVELADPARQQRHAAAVERVGEAMQPQGVQPRVGGDDLEGAGGGRIAVLDRLHVAPHAFDEVSRPALASGAPGAGGDVGDGSQGTIHCHGLLSDRRCFVHASRAKPLQIEGDIGEPESPQAADQQLAASGRGGPLDALGRQLDAGDVAMVADAQLGAQFQVAQHVFGGRHLAQLVGGHRLVVGDARGQTGLGRLAPDRQVEGPRKGAHGGLAEPGLDQRVAHAVLGAGPQAGPLVAQVVAVGAVDRAP